MKARKREKARRNDYSGKIDGRNDKTRVPIT
jgi:hypothetical protein